MIRGKHLKLAVMSIGLLLAGATPVAAQSFSWSGFTAYWRSHLQTTAGITQLALVVAIISVLIIVSGKRT